jgi:hypothetical protein
VVNWRASHVRAALGARTTSWSLALALALAMPIGAAGCTSSDPAEDGAGPTDEGDSSADEGGPLDAPTWHQDIHPLVAEHCGGCHRDGGIAPFSVETYEETSQAALDMLDAIQTGYMPPWHARTTAECAPPLPYKDDPTLSIEDVERFSAWIDGGKQLGDAATAAPLPEPPSLSIAEPDDVLEIPGQITIDGTSDAYACWVIDLENANDLFLSAVQVEPGNALIVHHVLVYATTSDSVLDLVNADGYYDCFGGPGVSSPSLIGAWAPGALPARPPEGAALRVAPNTKLVLQVHYHPTGGGPEVDATTAIEFERFAGLPPWVAVLQLIGNFDNPFDGYSGLYPGPNDATDAPEFRIPAGERTHTETMGFTMPSGLPEGARVWGAGTHMHYVGTDMIFGFHDQSADEDVCLIQTPEWDFGWQRLYNFDAPSIEDLPAVDPGDFVFMRCTYDNSTFNPHVAEALDAQDLDAPVEVFLGEATLDEMCLGVAGLLFPLESVLGG